VGWVEGTLSQRTNAPGTSRHPAVAAAQHGDGGEHGCCHPAESLILGRYQPAERGADTAKGRELIGVDLCHVAHDARFRGTFSSPGGRRGSAGGLHGVVTWTFGSRNVTA
jgi:hypothetical protein